MAFYDVGRETERNGNVMAFGTMKPGREREREREEKNVDKFLINRKIGTEN